MFDSLAASADRAASPHEAEPERAVILRGGTIITVDDDNPIGDALAIRGSRIVQVGSLTDVKRHYTAGTEIVDLEGCAILPGFVEPHANILGSALAAGGIDATEGVEADGGSARLAELLNGDSAHLAELCARTLHEFAARGCTTVYDPAIGRVGGKAEHELLRTLAHAPDAPVRVRGAFTPELATALGAKPGEGDERYDVVGIAYWADGPLQDFAAALGEPYLHGHGRGRLNYEEAALLEAMRPWHQAGWQLVMHAIGDRAVEQVLRCYEAILGEQPPAVDGPAGGGPAGELRAGELWAGESRAGELPAEELRAGEPPTGELAAGDGPAGKLPAGEPRAGEPPPVDALAGGAPSETARGTGSKAGRSRHRIEHAALADQSQIARVAALGLGVSHTINHIYYMGRALRDDVLGPERAARLHALRRDFERGVASSCHSDSPASPVDPCLMLRTVTTRLMRGSDDVLGPFQQLTLAEALRTVTRNAADHALIGDRVGSLRPGKLADLVVVDRDPREAMPERLHELRVLETWIGGRRQRWA